MSSSIAVLTSFYRCDSHHEVCLPDDSIVSLTTAQLRELGDEIERALAELEEFRRLADDADDAPFDEFADDDN